LFIFYEINTLDILRFYLIINNKTGNYHIVFAHIRSIRIVLQSIVVSFIDVILISIKIYSACQQVDRIFDYVEIDFFFKESFVL